MAVEREEFVEVAVERKEFVDEAVEREELVEVAVGGASKEEQTPEFSHCVVQNWEAPLETELLPVTSW